MSQFRTDHNHSSTITGNLFNFLFARCKRTFSRPFSTGPLAYWKPTGWSKMDRQVSHLVRYLSIACRDQLGVHRRKRCSGQAWQRNLSQLRTFADCNLAENSMFSSLTPWIWPRHICNCRNLARTRRRSHIELRLRSPVPQFFCNLIGQYSNRADKSPRSPPFHRSFWGRLSAQSRHLKWW